MASVQANGITILNDSGLGKAIVERDVGPGGVLVGVCLGMQLLTDGSEEGKLGGLGLIPGHARRLPSAIGQDRLLIPHMGWNDVRTTRPSRHAPRLGEASRYYFVHSYHVTTADPADVLGLTRYGIDFASAVERGSVLGFQFHPEKSHRFGWQLLSDVFGQNGTE